MRLSRYLLVLALVMVAVTATVASYAYMRSQQASIVEEKGISVTSLEVNKRSAVLVSVTLKNEGSASLILESSTLVKVQSGIALTSSKFSPPIILYPGNETKVYLSYQLDKEGADYLLYIFTNKGTAVKCAVSYP